MKNKPPDCDILYTALRDFRRIATRYDRSATNFLAAVCIRCRDLLLVMKSGPSAWAFNNPTFRIRTNSSDRQLGIQPLRKP